MAASPSASPSGSPAPVLGGDFLQALAQANQAEIAMAGAALQISTNADVRNFAQTMIDDHTRAGRQLDQAAQQEGFTLAMTTTADQDAQLAQLQTLTGIDFDRAYMRANVDAHQQAVALAQDEASKGTDVPGQMLASQLLPALQQHLRMAQDILNIQLTPHP